MESTATPTPGDQGVTPPTPQVISLTDHHAFVEKARQEEKTKLHDRLTKLEALQSDVARLNQALQEKEKSAAELAKQNQELSTTLTAVEKSKDKDGKVDAARAAKEAAEIVRQQQEAALKAELARKEQEWNERFSVLEKQNKEATLREARANAIQELGGPDAVIESMISGNTVEEVTESAKRSKALRDEIVAKAGQTVNTTGTSPNNGAGNTPAAPPLPNPSGGNPGGVGRQGNNVLNTVRTLTPTEYAANREKILSEAGRSFAGASGRG